MHTKKKKKISIPLSSIVQFRPLNSLKAKHKIPFASAIKLPTSNSMAITILLSTSKIIILFSHVLHWCIIIIEYYYLSTKMAKIIHHIHYDYLDKKKREEEKNTASRKNSVSISVWICSSAYNTVTNNNFVIFIVICCLLQRKLCVWMWRGTRAAHNTQFERGGNRNDFLLIDVLIAIFSVPYWCWNIIQIPCEPYERWSYIVEVPVCWL